MRFKINIYVAFSILIFHVFNFSFSQNESALSKAQKKEIQKLLIGVKKIILKFLMKRICYFKVLILIMV